jgi:hypothetical protein
MGKQYSAKAVEDAFALFLKFKGGSWHRIDQEMERKGYVGFKSKSVFPDRGKGEKRRDGWINKYNWREGLKLHLENLPTASLNNAQRLVREVETVRKKLFDRISPRGAQVNEAIDAQLLQLHRDYSKLSIEALTKVEAASDTLGAFVDFWERFLEWLTDIDPKTARLVLKSEDLIRARAEEEFGETEEMVYRRESEGDGDKNPAAPPADAGTER